MKAKLASFLLFLGFATEVVEGFSRSCRSSSVRPAAQLLHYVTKLSRLNPLLISASPQEDTDFLNAEQQPPNNNGGGNNSIDEDEAKAVDSIRQGLRRLAQLSLEDYDWRMSVFKEKEANRKVEEYMAGILGEDPDYVRPMDASEGKIGPLGRAEEAAVLWLSQVMEAEAARAKKIVSRDGKLVRPIEVDSDDDLGPLGRLEQAFVEFLALIRTSEQTRVKKGVLRPKDLDESSRGPLGQLELSVVEALRNIREAEILRFEQSKLRGGEVVRPIDVPGPLGEFELAVANVIQTERLRAKYGQQQDTIVRPKDAVIKGKLGEFEMQAVEAVRQLTEEERERLRSIKRKLEEQRNFLEDKRPMATAKDSLLGILEAILVGILRAPAMIFGVLQRVAELLSSENLDEKDKLLLENRRVKDSGSKKQD